MGDLRMEARNVYDKQEWRDRGPLGGPHRYRGKHCGGPLVEETARSAGKERFGPGHEIRVNPFGSEHAAEGCGVDVVKAPFHVEEESGDLPSSHLEGLHLVGEGSDCVRGREARQRATLVRVEEAGRPSHAGESRVHYPLEDLRECLK